MRVFSEWAFPPENTQYCYRPDEILGPYTGCADTAAEDGRASDEDPPAVEPTEEAMIKTRTLGGDKTKPSARTILPQGR